MALKETYSFDKAFTVPPQALPRRRFSALTRRIIFFNAFALLILIGGVLWIQGSRSGLVNERVAGIRDQALIVSSALAEYAAHPEKLTLNVNVAEPLLRQLLAPTHLRARVYAPGGRLLIDTRFLLARNVVTRTELPPPGTEENIIDFFKRMYDGFLGIRPLADLEPYFEGGSDGRVYSEVVEALKGERGSAVRVNEQDRLVLSVAVPVRRLATIYGAVLLTTESGDIDDLLKDERTALLQVFMVALGVMVLSSLYLAGLIAEPVRRLAAAAERVRRGHGGREMIPTLEGRADEIGELADSLSAMTHALYDRIDAIEKFAADVAHELKNPLTSLRSAIEVLERMPVGGDRERLVSVIRNDLKRIDRLISDVSDASRLDAELSRETSGPVDIGLLLETITGVYQGMDTPRGVSLKLALDLTRQAIVEGLDERLGQVFRNLIDNAVSFSPDNGVVTVGATLAGNTVRAFVEDQGPGIAEENRERIFNRFYTERPPEHGFGKNSGLGLAIARQIVSGQGGRIAAENKFNADGSRAGARFVVELPLAPVTRSGT